MINFELSLIAQNNCLLPPFTGNLIRGAIFQLIAIHDQGLSDKLHEGNTIRPYSISPILAYKNRLKRTRRGEIIIEKGIMFKFRMGILTSELAERMVKITLQQNEMKIKLAEGEFKVVSIEIKKKSAKELLLDEEERPPKFSLKFLTPTYFNISKQEFPMRFPEPRYLFMNLATLWNAFSEDKILVDQTELFNWVENHISVNAYNLRTGRVYTAKNVKKIGFRGDIKYQLSGDKKYQQWIHALAQFAEFSNVGGNRTAGLGCVKYSLEKERL